MFENVHLSVIKLNCKHFYQSSELIVLAELYGEQF
jgi:hypothetical protein